MTKENDGCITPGCDKNVRCRGLCAACYAAAILRVKSGLTTWEQFVEQGLALTSKKGRPGAFTAAREKQTEAAEKARKRCDEAAKEVTILKAPQVDQPPTLEEIRILAQKVANNPSEEAMRSLIEMRERYESPREEKLEAYRQQLKIPSDFSPDTPVPSPPPSQDKKTRHVDSSGTPAAPPRERQRSRVQILDEITPFDSDNAPALLPDEKKPSLRERSIADARARAAGQVLPEVDGGCDHDGMSNEEYDRIKAAIANDRTSPTTAFDPIGPQTTAAPVPSAPPQFKAPALPEVDLEYDPALDEPSKQETTFVRKNPIETPPINSEES